MQRAKWEVGKLSVGIALSVGSLVLALRDVDLDAMVATFANVDYALALLSLTTVFLTVVIKAIRWHLLLGRAPGLSIAKALSFLIIGQMINTVLPLRFGELGRIYLAAEKKQVPAAASFGSIVLEKAIDALVLIISLMAIVPLIVMPGWLVRPALLMGASAGLVLAALVLILCRRNLASAMFAKVRALTPWRILSVLDRHIDAFAASLQAVGDKRHALAIAAWSGAIWLLSVATNYLAFLAMGLDLPLLAAIFLLIVLQVGVAIPSAPGRIGVFQAVTVLGLSPFGIDPTTALGYSVLLYVIVFIPVTLVGGLLLWREQSSLTQNGVFGEAFRHLRVLAAGSRGHSAGRER